MKMPFPQLETYPRPPRSGAFHTFPPKKTLICNFMLQMGRYEQAGSGVYNVTKYLPQYTPGATPLFEELNDIFSATIPLPGELRMTTEN